MEKLFKKYDEMQNDIKVNGFDNLEAFKAQMNIELERCFAKYGEAKTIKDYQKMVRNHK